MKALTKEYFTHNKVKMVDGSTTVPSTDPMTKKDLLALAKKRTARPWW